MTGRRSGSGGADPAVGSGSGGADPAVGSGSGGADPAVGSGSGGADPAIRWSGRAWVPGERLSGRDADPDLPPDAPVVGVLALQGDVLEHLRALGRCGARAVRVRSLADLDRVDGLIIPGGESTTIGKLLERADLLAPLRDRIAGGLPTLGTCAGMILLSRELDQDAPQPVLGVLGVRTRRNAFGRQLDSFDTALAIEGVDGDPMDVSFIRAPWVEEVLDADVEVLASVDGKPVVVRQGHVLATAFHPEVTGDDRLHQAFVASLRRSEQ